MSDGYARNFLLPKKLAAVADNKIINEIKGQNEAKLRRIQLEKEAATATAAKLEKSPVTIYCRAGEDGKLYGSVTAKDISEALEQKYGIAVDKRKIVIDEPIKAFGTYSVSAKLSGDIYGKIILNVAEEK